MDDLARHFAGAYPDQVELRPFTPISGSDERQFCSPGYDFPVIQAARTVYGQYAEYHSSADDKRLMRIEQVEHAADRLAEVLEAFDYTDLMLCNRHPFGEPQLGRRGLYPTINSPMNRGSSADGKSDSRQTLNRLLMILSLADGTRDLCDMAEKIGCGVDALLPIVKALIAQDMLELDPKGGAAHG